MTTTASTPARPVTGETVILGADHDDAVAFAAQHRLTGALLLTTGGHLPPLPRPITELYVTSHAEFAPGYDDTVRELADRFEPPRTNAEARPSIAAAIRSVLGASLGQDAASFAHIASVAVVNMLDRQRLRLYRQPTAAAIDVAHLERQRAWSAETFGPGPRTQGVIDHIKKELVEVADAPDDASEWADIIILGFDGALRAGIDPQQIIDAIKAKQARNEARTWPDWRTQPNDRAIEHDRTVLECPAGCDHDAFHGLCRRHGEPRPTAAAPECCA